MAARHHCAHCNADLVDTDTHYSSGGEKLCGTCHNTDLVDELDAQDGGLAPRALLVATGALAIVVGIALVAWDIYRIFEVEDVGRRRREGTLLVGGIIAIGIGIQQLRRKY